MNDHCWGRVPVPMKQYVYVAGQLSLLTIDRLAFDCLATQLLRSIFNYLSTSYAAQQTCIH